MPTSPEGWIYTLCFFIGLFFSILSGILSGFLGLGGHDGGADGGGADGGGVGHDVHFSPVSPIIIAIFQTSFGGTGLICMNMFGIKDIFVHLPIALASGFVIAGGSFLLLVKVMYAMQKSSLISSSDLAGIEAEVLTPIPPNGLGEIAYVVKGTRVSSPARTEDNSEISSHSIVVISKVVGNTIFVKPKVSK